MTTDATTRAQPHKCEFPVQPPASSFLDPGPCFVCGKPYGRAMAGRQFARDPEALAWARGHVERVAEKYRRFESEARDRGDEDRATQWRKFANLLQMELIGGTGCVITAFDERLPQLPAQDEVAW